MLMTKIAQMHAAETLETMGSCVEKYMGRNNYSDKYNSNNNKRKVETA